MKKNDKMKICDWSLIVMTVLILLSGIQLEATGSANPTSVLIHIIVGCIFVVLIGWHLYLHFRWSNWIRRIIKQKSPVTRWLLLFLVLTMVSAIVATCHWLLITSHGSIGGLHGKIGFLFVILCMGHAIKRKHSPILYNRK